MSRAMELGTWEGIRLEAPYTALSKGEIASRGRLAGVDYAHTWSCYKGLALHCGRCGTCVERREALAQAGIEDPTTYDI